MGVCDGTVDGLQRQARWPKGTAGAGHELSSACGHLHVAQTLECPEVPSHVFFSAGAASYPLLMPRNEEGEEETLGDKGRSGIKQLGGKNTWASPTQC